MSEIPELLNRYRAGTAAIEEAVKGATHSELEWKPRPDKWNAREIVAHLADTEVVTALRLRHVIAEEHPTLVPFDQDLWAKNLDYQTRTLEQSLNTFRILREDTYHLLKYQPEGAFARTGKHLELGSITLLEQLRRFTAHAEKHAQQIRERRAAYADSHAK